MAEEYLRYRGFTGAIPDSIRFHPVLRHINGNYYPAMVAAIMREPDAQITGVHRTYLKAGKKADIEDNKKMLGIAKGGAVRIGQFTDNLMLAEGIETALSVYLATGCCTWATLSTSGLRSIIIPASDSVKDVTIMADNDDAGIEAANYLSSRLIYAGYKVYITTPSQTGWDFNDLLCEGI